MREGDLTYDDFLQRLTIQDVLIDAGYHLNKRDGLRYPSYVRLDSEGRRIRGDKFVVTQNGQCCFHAQQQRVYNLISFIKEHPQFFSEYHAGMSGDRLVNLVCNRLLNHPIENRETRIIQPKRDVKPFDITDYDIHKFNPQDRETQKKFYPYFKHRGIDLYTQYAFHRDFCLATKHRPDGSGSYKGKAEGSNSSEGLWIASPAKTPLSEAKHIYWFESAYDAMAYYQLHQAQNKELRKAVFVSTGGSPTVAQMRGVLSATLPARHHVCFDTDLAGMEFYKNFQAEKYRVMRSTIEETPERKPYLDTVREDRDLDSGEIYLLPETLQTSYGRFESEWEEAISMRSSGLCHPDDIQAQVDIVSKHYNEFREGLRDFLGLDKKNDVPDIREQPAYPNKDWNEQLLAERKLEEATEKEQAKEEEPEQERQTRFHR